VSGRPARPHEAQILRRQPAKNNSSCRSASKSVFARFSWHLSGVSFYQILGFHMDKYRGFVKYVTRDYLFPVPTKLHSERAENKLSPVPVPSTVWETPTASLNHGNRERAQKRELLQTDIELDVFFLCCQYLVEDLFGWVRNTAEIVGRWLCRYYDRCWFVCVKRHSWLCATLTVSLLCEAFQKRCVWFVGK